MITATGDTTTLADRKRRAGQRMVIGLSGPALTDDDVAVARAIRPAGFVLFARNCVEPGQVHELTRSLVDLCDRSAPPIVTIDQEGGRVQRMRAPATVWPAMRVVGRGGPAEAAAVGAALARELRAMGVHLNFAPVADVDSNPRNPVIGDRSFAADARSVSACVSAFIRAHQGEGVGCCAKHFPGHGDTSVDSHLALPVVEKEEPELREVELAPFAAAVRAGVWSLMTAHVVFPAFDEDRPATLSERVLPRLVRGELGFDDVVFSDDLDMKAISERWSTDEVVGYATDATVDVMLCCNQPHRQIETFEALVRWQEANPYREDMRVSAGRVMRLRERVVPRKVLGPALVGIDTPEHRALVERLLDRYA
jgi:beta-N-acetylhexosaminidase